MRVSPEDLGAPDLKLAGLQLWVHGRQFPDATDYYDGNWLIVTAHCGSSGASVWTSGAILLVQDLVGWAQQCEALRQGERSEAELAPMEAELKVVVQRSDGLGHFVMNVNITPNNMTQNHTFKFEIDQTYLPEITRQCRAIEARFPVRGRAHEDAV